MNLTAIVPAELSNHLWQSTLFAAVAGLLALSLRRNSARIRYALWLISSLKFLIPFSIVIAAGRHLQWWKSPPMISHPAISIAVAIEQIGRPFIADDFFWPPSHPAVPSVSVIRAVLVAFWSCGFVAVLCTWIKNWMRLRRATLAGAPVVSNAPVKVLSSPAFVEPGVFGIFRPVVVLPAAIAGQLAPSHLQAILAHEVCHVRRRDNLTAALHMLVEAIFWFNPVVWWIGARLIEEREHACDEEVLRLGNLPSVYAESILKICQLCLDAPFACAAGAAGGNIKERVSRIMNQKVTRRLEIGKKFLLASAGLTALLFPLSVGVITASETHIPSFGAHAVLPSFEVAFITVDESGQLRSHWSDPPGSFNATNITLLKAIETAYGIPAYQISGPEWLKSRRFDIQAAANAAAPSDQLPLMLQRLLRDRFKLSFHSEKRLLPIYALAVARNGPKLQPVNDDGHRSIDGEPGYLVMQEGSVARLAQSLSRRLDRPVIDKTGLAGVYKCELYWTQRGAFASGGAGSSIFPAIQEQLGLQLIPQEQLIETLVIDHLEKFPSSH